MKDIDEIPSNADTDWRSRQHDPPEPEAARIASRTFRRSTLEIQRVAVVVLAVAALGSVATAYLLRAGPSARAAAVLRDGELVTARGIVAEISDGSFRVCIPGNVRYGGTSFDPCSSVSVALVGVNPSILPLWTVSKGTTYTGGYVRVEGTWEDERIRVDRVVSDPRPVTTDYPSSPCPPPTGGWQPDDMEPASQEASLRGLAAEVEAHPDRYAGYWTSQTSDSPPRLITVVNATESADTVRPVLRAVFSGNLCVVEVPYDMNELRQVAARMRASDPAWLADVDVPADRVRLQIAVPTTEMLSIIGADASKVVIDPLVKRRQLDGAGRAGEAA